MKKTLLLLLSFILVGIVAFQIGKQKATELVVTPDIVQKEEGVFDCPYSIKGGVFKDHFRLLNEVKVVGKPEMFDDPQVIHLNKPFDLQEFEKGLYKVGTDNGWESREFDVDGDGKDEKIYFGSVAMNHTPHLVKVVKNGNVIFEEDGANIWLGPVYDGEGFLLKETVDWNTGEERWTRYISKDGGFMPVWAQKVCWVNFE